MFRGVLSFFLCICVSFSGVVYSSERTSPHLGLAQESHKDFFSDLEEVRHAILSQSRSSMDRYQLLRQEFWKPDSLVLSKNTKLIFRDSSKAVIEKKHFRASDAKVHAEDISSLSILHQGKLVHKLNLETTSIAWNSRFIIWVGRNIEGHQRLSFIDLNFVGLGKSELPIFSFPLDGFKSEELGFKNKDLIIGETTIKFAQLVDLSKINQIAFSLSVNLLDVNFAENTKGLVTEFHDLFLEQSRLAHKNKNNKKQQAQLHQNYIKNTLSEINSSLDKQTHGLVKAMPVLRKLDGKEREIEFEKLKSSIINNQKLGPEFLERLQESRLLKSAFENSAMARNSHLKLSARIHEFFIGMSVPRPDGAPKIKKALVHFASGVRDGKSEEFRESFYQAYAQKKIRYGLATLATVGAAALYPQEMSYFMYQSLSVGQSVVEAVFQKASEFVYLTGESVKATFSGFAPSVFSDVYINDGRWQKTLTGLSALMGMMFVTLGMPHFLVNGAKLAKDLRNYDYQDLKSQYPRKHQFLKRLKLAFIDRQEKEQRNYISLLQDADLKTENLKLPNLNAGEERELDKIIANVRAKDFGKSRWFQWAKKLNRKKMQVEQKHEVKPTEMNLRSAMMHFLFSFSSFTNSGVIYASVWNYWFIIRTLSFSPKLWPYLLMYPKFFKRAVLSQVNQVKLPTRWNGGMEMGLPILGNLWAKLTNKELHERVLKLETEIVDFEAQVLRLVLPKAFKESLAFSRSVKDFEVLSLENIDTYTDKHLSRLSFKTKIFFQWYVHISVERLVEQRLSELSGLQARQYPSRKQFKREVTGQLKGKSIALSDSEVMKLFNRENAKVGFSKLAAEKAQRSRKSMKNLMLANYQKALHNMDPRFSGQFKRFAVTEEQMAKPKAVARAVRASIVRMIIDKPMELGFLFVMVAGVSGGLLEPIHDEMFSENSWFYLSKYQFLKGFAYGLISGLLADVWMKLQQDARVDQTGGFDKVPSGERAKKGFWANLRYEMKASDNTWWQNQKYYAKLIWANMGAALVTMAAIQWVSLGRFDLDIYIAGYLIAYFSPLSGLGFKIENAFEKASSWVVRDIPQKYRSHPKVIQYSNAAMANLRIKFNIWYSIYENTVGHLMSNFQNMSTEQLGTRSFSRWVAGGYTFTETLINFTDALAEKYPIMEKPANLCRSVFLNNYTAGTKLNKK